MQNLYFGAGWKKLALQVGIKERESRISKASPSRRQHDAHRQFDEFSGYRLHFGFYPGSLRPYIPVFQIRFRRLRALGQQVCQAHPLHNQALYFKVNITRGLVFTGGLELWSQWGLTSPVYGRQPQSFVAT